MAFTLEEMLAHAKNQTATEEEEIFLCQESLQADIDALGLYPELNPRKFIRFGPSCPRTLWENPAWPLWLLADPTLLHELGYACESILWNEPVLHEIMARIVGTPFENLLDEAVGKQLSEHVEVHREIAQWCKTPSHVLEALAHSKDKQTRCYVADAQHTSLATLAFLASSEEKEVRIEVARRDCEPSDLLKTLAKDKNRFVRQKVAYNRLTPIHTLRLLAKDAHGLVREAVAANPSTPVSILKRLRNDRKWNVLENISHHPNTPKPLKARVLEEMQRRQSRKFNRRERMFHFLARLVRHIRQRRKKVTSRQETKK